MNKLNITTQPAFLPAFEVEIQIWSIFICKIQISTDFIFLAPSRIHLKCSCPFRTNCVIACWWLWHESSSSRSWLNCIGLDLNWPMSKERMGWVSTVNEEGGKGEGWMRSLLFPVSCSSSCFRILLHKSKHLFFVQNFGRTIGQCAPSIPPSRKQRHSIPFPFEELDWKNNKMGLDELDKQQ